MDPRPEHDRALCRGAHVAPLHSARWGWWGEASPSVHRHDRVDAADQRTSGGWPACRGRTVPAACASGPGLGAARQPADHLGSDALRPGAGAGTGQPPPVSGRSRRHGVPPWAVHRRRDVDVRETREEQCRTLESGWDSWLTRLALGMRVERDGPFPFVATVAGLRRVRWVDRGAESDGAAGVRLHWTPWQWFSGMARAAPVTETGWDWIILGRSSSRLKTDSFPHGLSTFPSSTLVAGH